jgi:hypothetical protein
MLLIIAHHHDAEAQWLCKVLKEEGRIPVYLLMPEALGVDYSISLHLKNEGKHRSTVFFHTPKIRLELSQAHYAINRLSYIEPLMWARAAAAEKTYATTEINAFFPALIHSLTCPVSNPIHHGALYGEVSFTAKWAAQLRQHGIAVHPLATDTTGKLSAHFNATPAKDLCRLMYFDQALILPPTQRPIRNFSKLRDALLEKGGAETLEFIFLKKGKTELELLHVSKTPALSCYGERFTTPLIQRLNPAHHDHFDGHSQRNPLAAAR